MRWRQQQIRAEVQDSSLARGQFAASIRSPTREAASCDDSRRLTFTGPAGAVPPRTCSLYIATPPPVSALPLQLHYQSISLIMMTGNTCLLQAHLGHRLWRLPQSAHRQLMCIGRHCSQLSSCRQARTQQQVVCSSRDRHSVQDQGSNVQLDPSLHRQPARQRMPPRPFIMKIANMAISNKFLYGLMKIGAKRQLKSTAEARGVAWDANIAELQSQMQVICIDVATMCTLQALLHAITACPHAKVPTCHSVFRMHTAAAADQGGAGGQQHPLSRLLLKALPRI